MGCGALKARGSLGRLGTHAVAKWPQLGDGGGRGGRESYVGSPPSCITTPPTEFGDLGDQEPEESSSKIGEWGSMVVSSTGVNLGTGLSRSRVRFHVPPRGGGARRREPDVDLRPCAGGGIGVPLVLRLNGARGDGADSGCVACVAAAVPPAPAPAPALAEAAPAEAAGLRPELERSMDSSPCRPIGGALAADGNRSIFSCSRPAH